MKRNWDRKSHTSLHLLAIVERKDIWSLRDLTAEHIPWLKHMRSKFLATAHQLYNQIAEDQLKLYVHCSSSILLLHINAVIVGLLRKCAKLTSLTRPTNILPLPRSYRSRFVRVGGYPSRWKSTFAGKYYLATGSYGRRERYGGLESDLHCWRGGRAVDRGLQTVA